jgi:hypothetical protein
VPAAIRSSRTQIARPRRDCAPCRVIRKRSHSSGIPPSKQPLSFRTPKRRTPSRHGFEDNTAARHQVSKFTWCQQAYFTPTPRAPCKAWRAGRTSPRGRIWSKEAYGDASADTRARPRRGGVGPNSAFLRRLSTSATRRRSHAPMVHDGGGMLWSGWFYDPADPKAADIRPRALSRPAVWRPFAPRAGAPPAWRRHLRCLFRRCRRRSRARPSEREKESRRLV